MCQALLLTPRYKDKQINVTKYMLITHILAQPILIQLTSSLSANEEAGAQRGHTVNPGPSVRLHGPHSIMLPTTSSLTFLSQ